MDVTDSLQFTHRGRKDIYEYVERHGTVRPVEIRRALNLEPGEFGHHLTLLKRDGYVREDEDGRLQVAFRESAAETYASDGLTFTVRQADQGDIDGLSEVVRTVAEEGSYIEAETVADVIDHERVVTRHNAVRSRLFFVATVDEDDEDEGEGEGEIIGWVHLDMPEAEKLAHTAVLTVGIDPAYRGHGVGSALLQRGMDWARERGFEKLYNSIPSTNQGAITFLEAHGWVTEAVRHDHYRVDDEYADEVMMAVEL